MLRLSMAAAAVETVYRIVSEKPVIRAQSPRGLGTSINPLFHFRRRFPLRRT